MGSETTERVIPVGWLTIAEAAEYMRLPVRRVRKMASSGELPGHKPGRDWRFLAAELDAWLAKR